MLKASVQDLFPSGSDAVILAAGGIICKKCVRSVQKVLDLRKQLDTKERELRDNIIKAGQAKNGEFV